MKFSFSKGLDLYPWLGAIQPVLQGRSFYTGRTRLRTNTVHPRSWACLRVPIICFFGMQFAGDARTAIPYWILGGPIVITKDCASSKVAGVLLKYHSITQQFHPSRNKIHRSINSRTLLNQ